MLLNCEHLSALRPPVALSPRRQDGATLANSAGTEGDVGAACPMPSERAPPGCADHPEGRRPVCSADDARTHLMEAWEKTASP